MCMVLVVDDEPDARDVISSLVKANGHCAMEAGSTEEALRITQAIAPDVITMDVNLSDEDGFEALQKLREQGTSGFAVVVSGQVTRRETRLQQWKELRIFEFVGKPFELDKLLDAIEAAAEVTQHEERLCTFLDRIISSNESSLSAGTADTGKDHD